MYDVTKFYREPDDGLETLARRVLEVDDDSSASRWYKQMVFEDFADKLRWEYGEFRCRMKDGTLLVVKRRPDIRPAHGREAELVEWLRQNGHDQGIRGGRPCRKYLRKLFPELPPDHLHIYKVKDVKIDIKRPRRIAGDSGTLEE